MQTTPFEFFFRGFQSFNRVGLHNGAALKYNIFCLTGLPFWNCVSLYMKSALLRVNSFLFDRIYRGVHEGIFQGVIFLMRFLEKVLFARISSATRYIGNV